MRLNRSTILSIMVMLLFGLVLFQAESFLGDYQIYIAKLIFINAILALSLNLIYGFTGLFSLGHAGFIAIGAYVSALCILSPEQKALILQRIRDNPTPANWAEFRRQFGDQAYNAARREMARLNMFGNRPAQPAPADN